MEYLQTHKCPCCGGTVQYDSSLQKVKCPYCDTEFNMKDINSTDEKRAGTALDITKESIKSGGQWSEGEAEGIKHYICQSCGGEIIADSTAALSCPYCGHAVTIIGNLTGELKPDLIIPFKVDKKTAKEKAQHYYKGKRVVPRRFRKKRHINEMKGVYVPYWLFSVDVEADAIYDATMVRNWNDSSNKYTETSYYNLYRSGNLSLQILVEGSRKISDDIIESLGLYDLNAAVEFDAAYLSGYLTDKYDENEKNIVERANKHMISSY